LGVLPLKNSKTYIINLFTSTSHFYGDAFLAVEDIMYGVLIEEWEIKILAKYIRNVIHVLCL